MIRVVPTSHLVRGVILVDGLPAPGRRGAPLRLHLHLLLRRRLLGRLLHPLRHRNHLQYRLLACRAALGANARQQEASQQLCSSGESCP